MLAAEGMRRRRRELAGEGQRQLEEATAAAFQILASVDHELYDPAPWPISRHHQQQRLPVPADFNATSDADGGGAGEVDGRGGSLDGARRRCKVVVAALRATIAVVPSSAQEIGSTEDKVDEVEIKRSEERASTLRKEIESENKNVKLLTDQLRSSASFVGVRWEGCSEALHWRSFLRIGSAKPARLPTPMVESKRIARN